MLWIQSFHIIFMVAWFAGLFYLPRLFVYHAECTDSISQERFKIMEKKLFYIIMTPASILTLFFGLWLFFLHFSYYQKTWMYLKLILVSGLLIYHMYCKKLLIDFKNNRNQRSSRFYRWFNEIPTLFLMAIVILAVVKP